MSNAFDGLGYRDKTIVLTGGSSGMGEAAAKLLGAFGAQVHIVDIQQPNVPHASFHRCDLSDFVEVRRTAETLRELSPIHFVFPCAGIPPNLQGAMKAMRVNYVGTRLFVEQLLPAVADGGGIALISSDAALGWQQNLAQSLEMLAIDDPDAAIAWIEADPGKRLRDGYTTSKEMLAVWVQNHAVKLGNERRIRLNAIAPCPTKTAFTAQVGGLEALLEQWPYPSLGRMATAEEQAWPLILLNSPLNGAVTGSFLYTDQGFASGVMTGVIDPSSFMGSPRTIIAPAGIRPGGAAERLVSQQARA